MRQAGGTWGPPPRKEAHSPNRQRVADPALADSDEEVARRLGAQQFLCLPAQIPTDKGLGSHIDLNEQTPVTASVFCHRNHTEARLWNSKRRNRNKSGPFGLTLTMTTQKYMSNKYIN